MRLLITRHGETVENVKRICQEQLGGVLSKKGITQGELLAERFKDEHIDMVFSSDAKRAIDTARLILKHHPNIQLQTDKRLREHYLGTMEGKPLPETIDWEDLPEDCETNESLCKRASSFIEFLKETYEEETILIVCHGGTKMALLNELSGKPVSELNSWYGIHNASITEVEIDKEGASTIATYNSIEHLDK